MKIRGYRIELGEIEETLRQHSAVRDAVAIARDDGSGNKRLVAYVVLNQDKLPSISNLRAYLQQKLPEYRGIWFGLGNFYSFAAWVAHCDCSRSSRQGILTNSFKPYQSKM